MRELITLLIGFALTETLPECPWVPNLSLSFEFLSDFELIKPCNDHCITNRDVCYGLCDEETNCLFQCEIDFGECVHSCPCQSRDELFAIFFFTYFPIPNDSQKSKKQTVQPCVKVDAHSVAKIVLRVFAQCVEIPKQILIISAVRKGSFWFH